jgi:hypothetical protein
MRQKSDWRFSLLRLKMKRETIHSNILTFVLLFKGGEPFTVEDLNPSVHADFSLCKGRQMHLSLIFNIMYFVISQ